MKYIISQIFVYICLPFAFFSCNENKEVKTQEPLSAARNNSDTIKNSESSHFETKTCRIKSYTIPEFKGGKASLNYNYRSDRLTKIISDMDLGSMDTFECFYDKRERLSGIRGKDHEEIFIYDKQGRLVKIERKIPLCLSFILTFEYNDKGLIVKETQWDFEIKNKKRGETVFIYDETGNIVSSQYYESGELKTSTLYSYDTKKNPFYKTIRYIGLSNYPFQFVKNNVIKEITIIEAPTGPPEFRKKGEKDVVSTIYKYNENGYPLESKRENVIFKYEYDCQ